MVLQKTSQQLKRVFITAMILMGAVGSASAQIANGGFEINGGAGFVGFSDWITADQANTGESFYAQTGSGTPLFGTLVPEPPEGIFAAMTEGGGANSRVLYQDFVVPLANSGHLSFQLFLNNEGTEFVTPNTLDFTQEPNQQARVDLLRTGSDPFSVAGSDVVLNLFQTQLGDSFYSGYTSVNADISRVLSAFGGQTLRLRFAEVDNLATFNFGVDNVQLVVPEPSSLTLLFVGGLSSLFLCRFRKQQSRFISSS